MSKKDDFYIGYLPEAPGTFAKRMKVFIILLVLLIPLFAFLIVGNEKEFPNSTFELGQLSTVEGVLTMEPVPMLKVPLGLNHLEKMLFQDIMLIGFGKFGAEQTLEKVAKEQELSLEGRFVKLEGTLIYYDGKTLLELSKNKASVIEVGDIAPMKTKRRALGEVSLKGEIADPKCFFGVMKPGEGKAHRSCAVRCISGGIPPILKATNDQGIQNYFIVLGDKGEKINEQVLSVVGEPITISGQLEQIDDWLVLRTDLKNDIKRLYSFSVRDVPMCNRME